jgi:hypothetical protein
MGIPMFDNSTKSLIVPMGAKTVLLAMDPIYDAERRVQEVATVNSHKAPELLSVFNTAYFTLNDHLTKLDLALVEARKAANLRRSVVILDLVPQILKQKGLSSARSPGGSEDQRKAILDADEPYLVLMDTVAQLEAMHELLDGKRKGFEWAFTSVKKIIGGEPSWKDNGLNRNPNLSAGSTAERVQPGQVVTGARAGFGGANVY